MAKAIRFLVFLAASLVLSTQAQATAVGITHLADSQATSYHLGAPDTVPFDIAPNGYNDDILWVWNENQNILLTDDLHVDWVADPSAGYVTPDGSGYFIHAGTIVSSHYVQWDPAGTKRVNARIEFDSDIFGYISSDAHLEASDDVLGLSGVGYSDFTNRGIEPPPHSNADSVSVDLLSQERVEISWKASSPGDWVRLITAYSPQGDPVGPSQPVPEPTSALLFCAGLVVVSQASRRGASGRL